MRKWNIRNFKTHLYWEWNKRMVRIAKRINQMIYHPRTSVRSKPRQLPSLWFDFFDKLGIIKQVCKINWCNNMTISVTLRVEAIHFLSDSWMTLKDKRQSYIFFRIPRRRKASCKKCRTRKTLLHQLTLSCQATKSHARS